MSQTNSLSNIVSFPEEYPSHLTHSVVLMLQYSPEDADWDVLSELVPIVEDDNKVDLVLDLELRVDEGST